MKPAKIKPVKGGGFSTRLRCGAGQHESFRIVLQDRCEAQDRANRMKALAAKLVRAGRAEQAPTFLRKAGEQATDAGMRDVEAYAAELCAKAAPEKTAPALPSRRKPTFRELGQAWTSGQLHALYPDQVPLKATAVDDASRLDRYAYPLIGDKPIDEVTLDDCEEIMRRIPAESRSRRHVAGTIARVFRMAVYPCRHIEASPLPKGFLPRALARKALNYLYPKNDRTLLACGDVPFGYRLLWGFLAREGMREGEALRTTWDCIDLEHGMIRLDENKTDDPRAWALDPGVTRALRIVRKHFAADAGGADRVFIQRSKYGLAETFRLHLERAGIRAQRPELFVSNEARQQIRVHDLRATFITISLANGKTERQVMAKTGHTTSNMLSRYHRIASSFAELSLGELTPLDQALPELAALVNRTPDPSGVCNEPVQRGEFLNENERPQRDSNPGPNSILRENGAGTQESDARSSLNAPEQTRPAHPNVQQTEPLSALTSALAAAAASGQWDIVRRLTDVLEARQNAAAAADAQVIRLDAHRGKRGRS